MNSKIADVSAYICLNYPHKSELSKTRLTKLVYLADWECAKRSQSKQITNIVWYFHNYGPYVDDVIDVVKSDERFEVKFTYNHYGDEKMVISVVENKLNLDLSEKEVKCIDKVITETQHLYWKSFIKHVYDTEPIKSSERYQKLDLVATASRLHD